MDHTYDVKLWKTSVYEGSRKTTHTVRWTVAGREWRQPHATAPLAESFRATLVVAMRSGRAFSIATGRPVSQQTTLAPSRNWYEFAVEFVDAQWGRTSANNRRTVAKVLMAATTALLRAPLPSYFTQVDLRTALREYGFNTLHRENAPREIAAILAWVQRSTLTMAAWEDTARVEAILAAMTTKLNGTPVAASSVKRSRRVLNVLMEYAVKQGVLNVNPLPKGRGTSPKASATLDKRSLINDEQAVRLLAWVRNRPRGGPRLHAFFATMYYAAPRPEELVAMRVMDVRLPRADAGDQWGELHVYAARPEVGRQWTDTGEVRDDRGLKGRGEGDMRVVPCRPALTRILREHIAAEKLKPTDTLFQGENGGVLAGSVIRRAWRGARMAVLTPEQFASPLGKRVYDWRHTCQTKWLNSGVPPAQVAEWAGNSVPVLLAYYARCISGHLADLKSRIEEEVDQAGYSGLE
ncbi:tyrosine-type recombinase/integrase [Streptomyces sp. NPDC048603]|uniref:tyrosine-type recombinase/integrase n=1 Tax=Streptomyces sp. NPDC048603 TaxID=3365577 RepID=UPI0037206A12